MPVLIVGTLDTKGIHVGFLRDVFFHVGIPSLVLDPAESEPGALQPDVTAQQGFACAEPYIYKNEVPEWGKADK